MKDRTFGRVIARNRLVDVGVVAGVLQLFAQGVVLEPIRKPSEHRPWSAGS
jgi:hypothetical protein